jgi:uncharacterized protein YegL
MSRFQKLLKAENKDLVVLNNGKQSEESLELITKSSNAAFIEFENNPDRYKMLVSNPTLAKNNEEKIGIMSAREIILLIDKSGSMSGLDVNPQINTKLQKQQKWTLWDSARVATESILEVSLAMDSNHKIDVTTFPAISEKGIALGTYKLYETGKIADIQNIFQNQPGGSTPLAEALNSVRTQKLETLLNDNIPFTVIVMTDGVPDNEDNVKNFFLKLVRDYRLYENGREYLAAFSFVQMGNNPTATKFLTDLDDNMTNFYKQNNIKYVDIIDTKKDNFLFGTDEFENSNWKGPFALLHDAVFD